MGSCKSAPAPPASINEAVNVSLQAASSARPLAPLSAEGAELSAELNRLFSEMEAAIRLMNSVKTADYAGSELIVLQSSYYRKFVNVSGPRRTYESPWLTFQYPDNGHWKLGEEPSSGIVTLVSAKKFLG